MTASAGAARGKVVLGVTGCIGAYKAPDLVRELRRRGFRVQVILTRAAREFVSPLALATVSGEPVLDRLFDDGSGPGAGDAAAGVRHISLTEETDLFLVAPATAHVIARLALGLADDFLTTFHLAQRAPLVIAPAMNTNMLEHAATRAHLETLAARGAEVVAPGVGELACGWMGPGRLPELAALADAVEKTLEAQRSAPGPAGPAADLAGRRILVASGPTREPIDPVRYLSNRSSGRMGAALAAAARDRGAAVTLVSGPGTADPPAGVETIPVGAAREMRDAVFARTAGVDALVMAAAVADFRPAAAAGEKLKTGALRGAAGGAGESARVLRLVPNPDILAGLGARRAEDPARGPSVLVGFAAETTDPEAEAVRKLERKRCDLIVGNRVGPGRVFGSDHTRAVLVERAALGAAAPVVSPRPPETKRQLADAILDVVARRLRSDGRPDPEPGGGAA